MDNNFLFLSEESDAATARVMQWVYYLNRIQVTRLNYENAIKDINIEFDDNTLIDFTLKKDNNCIDIQSIISFWYRRGDIILESLLENKKEFTSDINHHLTIEWETIRNFIYSMLDSKHSLGSYHTERYNNKLYDLNIASSVGLNVPNSLITTSKEQLINFFNKNENIITKPLKTFLRIEDENMNNGGTQIVNASNIDCMNNTFFPSFFQKMIEKQFELRIFFLEKNFFPMAIFSQNSEKTKIDYRNYDVRKPNRNVPFILEKSLQDKLINFIELSKLNTGSIDMIVTHSNEYFFLEVNPVGQFGWVSTNCNYFLHRQIAVDLINKYYL